MKKEDVQKFYDVVWTEYVPRFQESKQHLELFFNEEEVKGRRVLDCGCGTGIFCTVFGSMGAAGVTGLDISPGSLGTAAKLKEDMKLENIELIQHDMLQMPFPDASFDIVWAWGSAHHTEDPWRALAEIDRVLKPGGTLLLALYLRTGFTWLHEILRKTLVRTPKKMWLPLARTMAFFSWPLVALRQLFKQKSRKGEKLSELILDWYFVPIRFYFTPEEIRRHLEEKGYEIEKFLPASGRFKSASNFIYKARKAG